jgi:hypothetical protein
VLCHGHVHVPMYAAFMSESCPAAYASQIGLLGDPSDTRI